MAEHHYHENYHETRPRHSGGGTIAFIVGGLVVAVGLILYWVFGSVDTTATAPAGGGTDVEINATSDSAAGAGGAESADSATSGSAGTGGTDAAASSEAESGGADAGAAATAGADDGN